MIFSLALRNLRKNFGRAVLLIFSVLVGVSVLTIFAGIWFGVNEVLLSGLNESRLIVRPDAPPAFLNLISEDPVEFTPEQIEEVSEVQNVKNVIEQTFLHRATTLEMQLGLGPWTGKFDIDAMVFGTDAKLFEEVVSVKEFNAARKPVPVVVSSHLLDLYNFFVAEQSNLPGFRQEDFIGKKFDLYLDYSSLLKIGKKDEADMMECEIVAFSPDAQISGITVPNDVLKNWSYNEVNAHLLYVDVNNPLNLRKVESALEEMGYRVEVPSELKIFEKMSWYLALILGILAAIIWLAVGLSLATTFVALGEERRYEIGILRAIGSTPGQIRSMFFAEAGVIGFLGGGFGVLVGVLFGKLFNGYMGMRLERLSFIDGSIFQMNYWIVFGAIVFAVLVSLFAVLVPAIRASRAEIFTLIHEK